MPTVARVKIDTDNLLIVILSPCGTGEGKGYSLIWATQVFAAVLGTGFSRFGQIYLIGCSFCT